MCLVGVGFHWQNFQGGKISVCGAIVASFLAHLVTSIGDNSSESHVGPISSFTLQNFFVNDSFKVDVTVLTERAAKLKKSRQTANEGFCGLREVIGVSGFLTRKFLVNV